MHAIRVLEPPRRNNNPPLPPLQTVGLWLSPTIDDTYIHVVGRFWKQWSQQTPQATEEYDIFDLLLVRYRNKHVLPLRLVSPANVLPLATLGSW